MLSNDDFARVFRAQVEVRLVVDSHGRVLAVSDGYLLAHGVRPDDVIGHDVSSCPPLASNPAAAEQVRGLLDAARRADLPQTVSLSAPTSGPTEEVRTVEAIPVHDEHGKHCHQVVTYRRQPPSSSDASDRERRLSKLIEHSYDALALFDEKGNTLYSSPSFRRNLGFSADTPPDASAISYLHEDDIADFGAKVRDLHGRPGGEFITRIRVRNPTGGHRVLEVRNRNLLDDSDVAAVVSHSRDVTEDVQLQEQLKWANERISLALASARALSWEVDLASGKGFYSEDFCQYFGLSPEAFAQEGPVAAIHPSSRADVIRMGQLNRTVGGDLRVEFRGCDRDGEPHWYASFGRAQQDAQGKYSRLLGITWDITEQRRLLEERAALDQRVRESQKLESLGVLAGGIAHDFNNLLTAILGHAGLARGHSPASQQHHLLQIEEAAQRASDLCRQMLAYAGKGKFVLGATDINRLIEDTMQLLKVSISKKVQLSVALDRGLPKIIGDATQLRQVLMNLVINASEAISESIGVISVRTGVMDVDSEDLEGFSPARIEPGRYAFLDVADTGSGMSEETRARIFEPFFSTKFTGRGLGLSAVLGIVRGHHGALRVQSALGRGTCFTMLLPLRAETGEETVPSTPATSPNAFSGTVLLADDEEAVRVVTKEMLEEMKFSVVMVRDGHEAIRAYRDHRSSLRLIVMDLTMPRLDGHEALLEMQMLGELPEVILMSGHSEQDVMARFASVPGVHFLQKPFSPEQLQGEIFKALSRRIKA
ncbi:MAG: PAS domain S-box protein [Myxococcales bacterium]